MEALFKAINEALSQKDLEIFLLKTANERLEKENVELMKENEALKTDVKMYEENEVKGI